MYAPIFEKQNSNGFDRFGVCVLICLLVRATFSLVSTVRYIDEGERGEERRARPPKSAAPAAATYSRARGSAAAADIAAAAGPETAVTGDESAAVNRRGDTAAAAADASLARARSLFQIRWALSSHRDRCPAQ